MDFKAIYLILLLLYISTIVSIEANNKPKKSDPISHICSHNEVYSTCNIDCTRGKTCDDIERKVKCKKVCLRGCFCKSGYYRDFRQNGKCVEPLECKSSSLHFSTNFKFPERLCSINEEYICGSNCGKQCVDIGKEISCGNSCETGCYCKDGYYRDLRLGGQCVREKACLKKDYKKFSKDKNLLKWVARQFEYKTH